MLWWVMGPLLVLTAPQLVDKLITGIVVTFRCGTLSWLGTISPYEWLLMAAVATWGWIALIQRREDKRRRQEAEDLRLAPPFVAFWQKFRQDLATVDDMSFENVLWTVNVPLVRDADGGYHAASTPPDLAVKLPPRCPKCGFDLRESAFEGAYRWQCTACPFDRLSRQLFSLWRSGCRGLRDRHGPYPTTVGVADRRAEAEAAGRLTDHACPFDTPARKSTFLLSRLTVRPSISAVDIPVRAH